MTEFRDWSITASANNGTSANGYFREGIQASELNEAAREMQAIRARYITDTNGTLVSTTPDGTGAYQLAISAQIDSYRAGDRYVFRADSANELSASIAIVGSTTLSARSIVHADGSWLMAGDIVAGGIYEIVYRSASANFQLMNPSAWFATDKIPSMTGGGLAAGDAYVAFAGANRDETFRSNLHTGYAVGMSTSGAAEVFSTDTNSLLVYTGSTATDTFTLDTGAEAGDVIIVANHGAGAGPKIAAGVNVTLVANGDLTTVSQNGVAFLNCWGVSTWVLSGDLE